jgi:hypothetical protein
MLSWLNLDLAEAPIWTPTQHASSDSLALALKDHPLSLAGYRQPTED